MVNVVVEPYEPLVNEAIRLIESRQPHYFDGVSKIILEQGNPQYFGKVQSDQKDVIFISIQKLKSALAGASEEDLVHQIAEVLAHEMGHLKADFEGGEPPAEKEEEAMRSLLRDMRAARYESKLYKQAYIKPFSDPVELADSILRIVYHFAQKVNPENQRHYLENVFERVRGIVPGEVSSRERNPGGGIGSTVSLIKNILAGLPLETVSATLSLVDQRIMEL